MSDTKHEEHPTLGEAEAATFWHERSALVTGATGMIGSWLVRELIELGAKVVALVKDADPQSELYRSGDVNRVSVANGSLEDFRNLERIINLYEVDSVFHLGAQTLVGVAHRFPLATLDTNIQGTYNLLEACRIHRDLVGRIVIASSDKAYGEQPNLPYTEDMRLSGRHPYEVSKSCADMLAQAYFHTYALPVAITRCGNVYGGGDLNWSRIVPGTIRSLLMNQRPIIRSDGSYVRDYIYVKDVARAYIRTAEQLHDANVTGQGFNFSAETPVRALEIVEMIGRLTGCEHLSPDIRNTATGEIPKQYLSSAKARSVLRWKAQFDLEAGLGETIDWYRAFLA